MLEVRTQEKPRFTYAQFLASQQFTSFTPPVVPPVVVLTLKAIIERYIVAMDGTGGEPPIKPIGLSHRYTLRRLQRAPIGSKPPAEITKQDVIAHCRTRQAAGIKPQTVQQDVTYLVGVLKYAGSAWEDCDNISAAAVDAAKPFLKKHNLTCKSAPRDRLPSDEEIASLRIFFRKQALHKNTRLPMETLMDWQIASGRRIGETCKLLWEDWDRENQTIVVRKMKDPRKKNKRKVVALPNEAQAMLVGLEARRDPTEPRVFPYNDKSVGASYTRAKKILDIKDLRLHDSRAKCYTSMREKGIPGAIAILVTGHETEALPERVYKRMKAADFKTLQHVREAA